VCGDLADKHKLNLWRMNMRLRNLIGGVAISLFALCTAPAAFAADYNGNCANVNSWNGQGNATISEVGACTITAAVTATGSISVSAGGPISTQALTASGGPLNVQTTLGAITSNGAALKSGSTSDLTIFGAANISTGAISAGGSFGATTAGGTISTTSIDSNTGGNGGNVLLQASGDIGVGDVNTHGGTSTGGVEIDANNTTATGHLFTIGSMTSNGVKSINTSNTTAGGLNNDLITGGLFITNGNATATGGIKVMTAGSINVVASASRSGFIILNAQAGQITLPAGVISSDGVAGAGDIELYAATVNTVDTTTLSATQPASAGGTDHGVQIVTSTINVTGTTGFKIAGDGNGFGSSLPGFAAVYPPGSCSRTSNGQLDNLLWSTDFCAQAFKIKKALTITGAGAFTASANGNDTVVDVSGYPITFSNGALTLTAKGTSDHNINIEYSGTYGGTSGLAMTGTGAILIDASGVATSDSGGQIHVYTDQAKITAPSFIMHADGVGSLGNGGFVVFQPTAVTSLSSATAMITANGVGGTVEFQPNTGSASGPATITSSTFTINANAPSGAGNAGSVYFQTGSLTLGSSTKAVVTSNGPTNGTGNGNYVDISPGTITTLRLGTAGGDLQVLANAGKNGGNGGTIFMNPNGSIVIDTANAVSASVPTTNTNGMGGIVRLYGNPGFSVTSGITGASINVDGRGTGMGGQIALQGSGTTTIGTAAGGLSLSAQNNGGTGGGGSIDYGYATNVTVSGTVSASAGTGSGSTATGGTIKIHDIGQLTVSGTLSANGGGSGTAGSITLSSTSYNKMVLDNSKIHADGDPNGSGSGNQITITNAGPISLDTTTLTAQGGGSGGDGGYINIAVTGTGQVPIDVSLATPINASANPTNGGMGGHVVINSASGSTNVQTGLPGPLDVNTYIKVSGASGASFDGSISLNGLLCQQQPVSYSPFPTSYWDCVSPANPTVTDKIPATLAGTSLSTTLKNKLGTIQGGATTDQIYVFTDATSFSQFFAVYPAKPTTNAGFTLNVGTAQSKTYVAPFENASLPVGGYSALTMEQLQESTAHELGHGVDLVYGQSNQSANATFVADAVNDLLTLDFSVLGTNGKTSTPRPPCSTNNTAPFDNVVDESTGAQFCNASTGKLVSSKYSGMTNSLIIATSAPGIFPTAQPLLYQELYAQAFAYQLFVKPQNITPSSSFVTTVNGVFARVVTSQTYNYFACTQTWLANVLPVVPAQTPPAYCSGTTSWYIPYQTLQYWQTH